MQLKQPRVHISYMTKKSARTSEFMSSLLASSNDSDEQEMEMKPANDTLQRIFSDNIEKRQISTSDAREAAKEHTVLRQNVRSVYLKL